MSIATQAARKVAGGGFATAALGIGMNVAFEDKNQSMATRVAKGVGWFALETFVPGAMMVPLVSDVAGALGNVYTDTKRYGEHRAQKHYRNNFGGNFNDTQQGYTMRQRGLSAINASRMNARSVLGSEARTYHR